MTLGEERGDALREGKGGTREGTGEEDKEKQEERD